MQCKLKIIKLLISYVLLRACPPTDLFHYTLYQSHEVSYYTHFTDEQTKAEMIPIATE